MDHVRNAEETLWWLWSRFGDTPESALHDQDGLLWFETAVPQLPYNGVLRTRLPDGEEADARIARIGARMRERGAQFFWVDHPSATPADLGERLTAQGLPLVETLTGMTLDLSAWEAPPAPPGVTFEEVTDADALSLFTAITRRHWEIPQAYAAAQHALHAHWAPGRLIGHRYLALLDGVPVGKGYVSSHQPEGVAAIFGMSVLPEARRRGVAMGITATLLARARDAGCQQAVLHSTEMGFELYRKAGFEPCCEIPVHATAALWSDQY